MPVWALKARYLLSLWRSELAQLRAICLPGATPSTSAEIDLESGAVPESRALRPFSEVSSISIGGVDVDVGAELSGERFLVLTASHGYGAKSHLPRVLKAEVTEPTNSPHCDQISGLRTGVL